ncbi:MAG: TonB-dependent receptor, partial [Pedobacter sp.]
MKFLLKSMLVLLFVAGTSFYSHAQNYVVKGKVLDTAGLPLPGAVVRIRWSTDSLAMSANSDGGFTFNKVKSPQITLSAAFIGFQPFTKQYNITEGTTFTAPDIKLKLIANTLDQVIISGVPPVRVTEDTVSFNAASFPVREGDAVDEVLKKLPGIKVDKDGNVTNQGTPVTKIRVNGKDFFGTDVATAIKNLPAEIIKNLQFIDDYGDQAKLTGIKTGEPEKILNLTIQEDKKKGYFARASGGVGNSDRYNTSLRANSMKNERMISVDGTVNNANLRGGGGDGITTRNAAGLNYKNEWSEKFSADGGYSFNNTKNNTISSTYTQNFLQNFTRFEDARNDNENSRFSHDFWGNVELEPDSMNYLKISPNFSYNTNEGLYSGFSNILQQELITNRTSGNFTNGANLNARTNVFYNHKLAKKGRNLNFWGSINYSRGDDFRDVSNDYVITEDGIDSLRFQNQLTDQDNQNFSTNAGGSYMEPLWEKTFLEVNYNWSKSATTNIKDTRDVISGNEVFNPD